MHRQPIICSKGWVSTWLKNALVERSVPAAGRPAPTWMHTGTSSSWAAAKNGRSAGLSRFPPAVEWAGVPAATKPSSSTHRLSSLTASSGSWIGTSATPLRRSVSSPQYSASQLL